MSAVAEIVEQIKRLTVSELMQCVDLIEKEFGVRAVPPPPAMAPALVPSPAPAQEEEQTSFSVVLREVGANKIQVIKAVRGLTSLGLKEAKELVDRGGGTVIKEGLGKDEANKVKADLEAAGATIDLK